jgi:hypothetical protein
LLLDEYAKHLDSTIVADPRVKKPAFMKEDLIGNDEDFLHACPDQGFTNTSRLISKRNCQ